MFNLPREVIKWLQCLDLSKKIQNPKWDVSNGAVIGEIFNLYYPKKLNANLFNNGQSIDSKLKNWYLIKNFIKNHNINVSETLIDGTIYMKEGAAVLLLRQIHNILTNKGSPVSEMDLTMFNDSHYQQGLALHARSTASVCIKNNLSIHELAAESSLMLNRQKAQHLVLHHRYMREDERKCFPERYQVHQTIGERCMRNAPKAEMNRDQTQASEKETISDEITKFGLIHEVSVNQPSKINVV